MKKVLLLGDSIRLGYRDYVKEILKDEADVVSPDENCRFAKYSLWEWTEWHRVFGNPDIIHWNNGIWDVYKLYELEKVFTPVNEYLRDMQCLYNQLKQTGAKIIFATTTEVRDDCNVVSNDDVVFYNSKIVEMLTQQGVSINDLNSVVRPHKEIYVNDTDKLHLTDDGYKAVGQKVAEEIRKYL